MVTFLLYLFEACLCMSILFLVYVFFFRKETYFNFNRIYLISIMVVSLILPAIHVSIKISSIEPIHDSVSEIGKIRSYYAELISKTDPEFTPKHYAKYEPLIYEGEELQGRNTTHNNSTSSTDEIKVSMDSMQYTSTEKKAINVALIILIVYFAGVAFFSIRLLLLTRWLFRTIKNNPHSLKDGQMMVLLHEQIPPFSFFKYIFVNKEATLLKEFEQILAHEKIHIRQRHSLDLFIAHGITVFMWFNPLTWQLQKAIKTTHEYIADSKVVNLGYELFDYQSLLLSHLVGIHSIELVNNFNLLFIKKRIVMMTKNKSSFNAKLKALLIIPTALVVFFLFANLTINTPLFNFTNFGKEKTSNLDGIWENKHPGTFGKLLNFNGTSLSILEKADDVQVVDLSITIKDDEFTIMNYGNTELSLKYQFVGEELKIWWNDTKYSMYSKTNYTNSYEALIPKEFIDIELPQMDESKILDQPGLTYNIYVYSDKYFVENKQCNFETIKETIQKRISLFNVLDRPYVSSRLYIDKNTQMKAVHELYKILRELQLNKVALATIPANNTSVLQYHSSAIPQKLPPLMKDGLAISNKASISDRIIVLSPDKNITDLEIELEKFIQETPDYVASFEWENATKYADYLAVIDMTYRVLFKLRDSYAISTHGMKYSDLPVNLQKELRKKYPMRLSQTNLNEE